MSGSNSELDTIGGRLLDQLAKLNERLNTMEKVFIKMEADLAHHMASEDARSAAQSALEKRVSALEELQQQAKGAASLAKLLWVMGVGMAGSIGWLLKTLIGGKP